MRRVAAAGAACCVVGFSVGASAASPERALAVGARVGPQALYLEGDGAPSDLRGTMAGLDLTLHLSSHLGLSVAAEGTVLDHRSDRLQPGPAGTSLGAFVGLAVDTNREGPWSARIDLATGARWLALPLSSGGADTYGGFEPLRLRVGPAYRAGGLEVSLALGVGFGWFWGRGGADCAVTGSCADSLIGSDTAGSVHFVGDLTLAIRGWP